MRLLIVGLNFHPELTGIGKYTGEMAHFLAAQGHEVRVVTTPPYYPYWQVQSGYQGWQYRHETWQGLHIYRCPLWVPHKPTGIKRLVHLFSFAFASFPMLLWQMRWHPDLVFCIAPAFFSAPFALIVARLCGAKSWLHIQDFELDTATNLGMLPSRFLIKWAAHWESWILARFDRVSTISNQMLSRLDQKRVKSERTCLFPNWVDTNLIFPLRESKDSLRRTLHIPDEKIVVLYSGNMGTKQSLENIAETARRLKAYENILFIFCGDGAGRQALESATQDLPNVKFLPLQPIDKLNQLLNLADIHLLPQKANVTDLVMPSKLLGMLASGKVIVASALSHSEIGRLIKEVGVLVSPDDELGFDNAILNLAKSRSERLLLGEKGRTYVCENWSADLILPRFQMKLQELVNLRAI